MQGWGQAGEEERGALLWHAGEKRALRNTSYALTSTKIPPHLKPNELHSLTLGAEAARRHLSSHCSSGSIKAKANYPSNLLL